ncbi:AraC family transcriptional regulator [Compostibacter hankyongensis]|uniref:AraC family transcriptional regulator n=1 Tax=Compostibacter hankyongensis TaxID=1007089 RepID=A0ABP8G190_9BACT
MKIVYEHQSPNPGMGFIVKEYRQDHFTSPFHFHDLYELILIVRSYGKLYAGNKVLNFKDNEVFLFAPGFAHCFYNERSFISSGETAHAIVIFFRGDFLGKDFFSNAEMARSRDLFQNAAFGIKVTDTDALMHGYFTSITQKSGMDALIILLQLINLLSGRNDLSLINPEVSRVTLNNADSARLEPVLKYVIENFKDEIYNREAAALACLNEAAFCRYFKSRTQQTFSQFVNNVRVVHAADLLLKEDRGIADIGYECGFKNISYFNRQFKNIMGQTPMAYRNTLKRANDTLIV